MLLYSRYCTATTLVGIRVLNHIINAAILIFVMSAANSDLYIGSRTLYGLAIEGKAPRIFARVNRMGVPYPALILCTAFCGLVFLNVSSSSAKGQSDPSLQIARILNRHSLYLVCQLGVGIWSYYMDVHCVFTYVRTFHVSFSSFCTQDFAVPS